MLKDIFSGKRWSNVSPSDASNDYDNVCNESVIHMTPLNTFIYTNYYDRDSTEGITTLDGANTDTQISLSGALIIVPTTNIPMITQLYGLGNNGKEVIIIDFCKVEKVFSADL